MSCRLITGKHPGARTIVWSEVERGADGPPALPHVNLYSDPGASAERPSGEAHRTTEERITEAYQRGFCEGEAAATQGMAQQVSAKIEQLSRSIEQLALHRGKIQREAEPELVRLSMAIARRILRRELSVDPDSLHGLIKVGLEKIEASEIHRVRVHPDHASVLARLLEGSARPVDIAADPGLPVGAVIFETARGSLDAGLETQLKEIERGFADLYPR